MAWKFQQTAMICGDYQNITKALSQSHGHGLVPDTNGGQYQLCLCNLYCNDFYISCAAIHTDKLYIIGKKHYLDAEKSAARQIGFIYSHRWTWKQKSFQLSPKMQWLGQIQHQQEFVFQPGPSILFPREGLLDL
jgi:hypothetical protein